MLLAALAFFASTLGAISGLGGGIFLMPILVETYGHDYSAGGLATISLSVVMLNALTALFLGRRVHEVDFSFAPPMAGMAACGAALGVFLQSLISRSTFEVYLAAFLFLLGLFVLWRSPKADSHGGNYVKGFRPLDGAFSMSFGVLASFFGVGGGVLQVPYMVYFRHRPVKQATAISLVILATVSTFSLSLLIGWRRVAAPWPAFFYMAPAVMAGGVVGSRVSRKLKGPWIVRILAVVLLYLAYRVGSRALGG